MKFSAEHEVLGQTVKMTVEIIGAGAIRGEAQARIIAVMTRETERFAQIAGVDVRDQPLEAAERMRLKALPPEHERPAIVLGVGTKDPEKGVAVIRGTWTVGKDKRKMTAKKDKE